MKKLFFLGRPFKVVGTICLVLSILIWLYIFISDSYYVFGVFVPDRVITPIILISLLFVIFSKSTKESSQLYEIRAKSLFFALLINLVCGIILTACLSFADSLWLYYGSLVSVGFLYIIIYSISKIGLNKNRK